MPQEIPIYLAGIGPKMVKTAFTEFNGYLGHVVCSLDYLKKYIKKFDHVMVQRYLEKVKDGDKRVFIINGKVKGAIRRLPKKGSILSNISQGGVAIKTKLNLRELKISKLVAKSLKKENIFFAGIDLIDQKLNGDINVTSPTGLKTLFDISKTNLAKIFWKDLKA